MREITDNLPDKVMDLRSRGFRIESFGPEKKNGMQCGWWVEYFPTEPASQELPGLTLETGAGKTESE